MMTNLTTNHASMSRYILYARKSSESEDRQVLSIDSQIHELQDVARTRGLAVTSVLSESRSAKAPGRPVFARMLKDVQHRRADGVLCWKLDRLARNPVDGAALIWALDEGKLQEIVTREKTFTNRGDEKFWMQLEFGMAKKYVDDLSDNVKRGNRAKLSQGWLPGMPPFGYLNDFATKTIIPDAERFQQVRRIWDLILAGRSTAEVLAMVNEEWGLRTPRRTRSGGRPLSRSTLYAILGNPFYYGLILRHGESYPGAHPAMVTKAEFDRVQEILGRPNRRARDRHDFAYTGIITCGDCGASVTAEHKVQRHGHRYIYYHCTKRKPGPRCSQPSVEVDALEEQIQRYLGRIAIDDRLLAWALKRLRLLEEKHRNDALPVRQSLASTIGEGRKESAALLDLRLRGLLSDEEFALKRQELVEREIRVKERMLQEETAPKRWFEPAERAFMFANQAPKRFTQASHAERREILLALGSNLELKDKVLRMKAKEPFVLMEEGRRSQVWLSCLRRIRTYFIHHEDNILWPGFCENASSRSR